MGCHGNHSESTGHLRQMLLFGLLALLWCVGGAAGTSSPEKECGPIFLDTVKEQPPRSYPLPPSAASSVWVSIEPPHITWGNLSIELEGQGRTLRLNLSRYNSLPDTIMNVHLRLVTIEIIHQVKHGRRTPPGAHVHLLQNWPVLLAASAWNNFSIELLEHELILNINSSHLDRESSFISHRADVNEDDLDSFKNAVIHCTHPCGVYVELPCFSSGFEESAASMSTPPDPSPSVSLRFLVGPLMAIILGFLVIMTLCLGLAWCRGRSKLAEERQEHHVRSNRVRWSNGQPDEGGGGRRGEREITETSYVALEVSDISSNGIANDAFRNSALQIS